MKRVLDIGQCPPDHAAIKRLITSLGAEVKKAVHLADAMTLLDQEKFDLICINRKIDIDYSDGSEILKSIKQSNHKDIPVMIISNYPEAHKEAMKHGAVLGFGKDQLSLEETRVLLKQYI